MNKNKDFIRQITRVLGAIVSITAIMSFVLSFSATSQEACLRVTEGWLCYLYPFVIEFAAIAFLLWAFVLARLGLSRRWPLFLTVLFMSIAALINVAHAKYTGNLLQDLLTGLMASLPPFVVILSFEAFASIVKATVTRGEITGEIGAARAQLKRVRAELDSVQETLNARTSKATEAGHRLTAIETEVAERRGILMEQVQADVASEREGLEADLVKLKTAVAEAEKEGLSPIRQALLILAENSPEASQAEFARLTGKGSSTISGHIKALTESGMLHKNGSGWEVKS